jgi:ABC-type Zn2+ transport system substrate-binding protein/surface adhesin
MSNTDAPALFLEDPMPHIMTRLRDADLNLVKQMLSDHAPQHQAEGMTLQHLWVHPENPREVSFLHRVADLTKAMTRLRAIHAEALRNNPQTVLPETIYLADV